MRRSRKPPAPGRRRSGRGRARKAPRCMPDDLLTTTEAARRLGISVTSLYDWLGRSDRGLLVIRGREVAIDYLQGGPAGQGRIRIEPAEIERIKELMRVRPCPARPRQSPVRR